MTKSKATVGSVPRPKGYHTEKRSKFSGKNKAAALTSMTSFTKAAKRVTEAGDPSNPFQRKPSTPAAGMPAQLNRTGGGQ